MEGENLLEQIHSLVSDQLQVVSYKWLSRKYSIASNDAKRLLQEFVDNCSNGIEVVYVVSGWSKMEPPCYSVQLVPKSKLEESKASLAGSPSSHIYSVQASLPKDPAQLWSLDFTQSEELFNQPPDMNNCLRDNRFSAVSCSLVTRSLKDSTPRIIPAPPAEHPASAKQKAAVSLQQSLPPDGQARNNAATSNAASKPSGCDVKDIQAGRGLTASDAKGLAVPTSRKQQLASGGQGELASLWGRTSTKPKATSPVKLPASEQAPLKHISGNADSLVKNAIENDASSDDDATEFARMRRGQLKRGTARSRRVIFDEEMSDENGNAEDTSLASQDITSLASPEIPEGHANLRVEQDNDTVCRVPPNPGNSSMLKENAIASNNLNGHIAGQAQNVASGASKELSDKPAIDLKTGPKKRKILKTRIDDRGREVTEVVWEIDGMKEENAPASPPLPAAPASDVAATSLKEESHQRNGYCAPESAKPAAPQQKARAKSGGKATGKNAGKVGAHQGNILSFFKKKT